MCRVWCRSFRRAAKPNRVKSCTACACMGVRCQSDQGGAVAELQLVKEPVFPTDAALAAWSCRREAAPPPWFYSERL